MFGTIIIIVDGKETNVRKREVIKEARELNETGMRTNCQVYRRYANMLEQIEYRSDMIEYQTMVLVLDNLRYHITTKHFLLS